MAGNQIPIHLSKHEKQIGYQYGVQIFGKFPHSKNSTLPLSSTGILSKHASHLDDHPRTRKWFRTMVIVLVPQRIGQRSLSKWSNFLMASKWGAQSVILTTYIQVLGMILLTALPTFQNVFCPTLKASSFLKVLRWDWNLKNPGWIARGEGILRVFYCCVFQKWPLSACQGLEVFYDSSHKKIQRNTLSKFNIAPEKYP